MKFGHLFEFHKIPEWYTEYVHYKDLRDLIDQFKKFAKEGLVHPLNGYYTINKKGQIYCIDFIKNYKQDTTRDKQYAIRSASIEELARGSPKPEKKERSFSFGEIEVKKSNPEKYRLATP